MLIHSAHHLTYLGRNLEINLPSEIPNESAILVLTKSMEIPFSLKEKTRITSDEIAKSMGIRKFLKFSEKTSVKVGSFDIKMAEMAEDRSKFNFFINEQIYFMTFLPEIHLPFAENMTLLIPAGPDYFSDSDLPEIKNFIVKKCPKRTIMSGNFSEKWLSALKSIKNIEIRNEISQQSIF